MQIFRPLLVTLAVLAPAVTPVAAQAPLNRGYIAISDRETGAAVIDEARELFRRWEESGDPAPAHRARQILRRLRVDETQRAEQMLVLAMVLARGPDSRLQAGENRAEWFVDYNSLASMHSLLLLRHVLADEPRHRGAALELATWALERDHPLVAAEAEIALVGLERDADVLLARAQVNLLFEDFDSAASLAAEATAGGADAAVGGYVRAYALLQDRRTREAGLEAYYQGARRATPAGRFLYERSVGGLLSPDEMERVRAVPDDSLADHLRGLWERRAATAGVMHVERVAEHFRRLHRSRMDNPPVRPLHVSQIFARYATGVDPRGFGLSLSGLSMVRHGDPHLLDALQACLSDPAAPPARCAPAATRQYTMGVAGSDGFNPFRQQLKVGGGVYAFRGAEGQTDLVFGATLPTRSVNALVNGSGSMDVVFSAILVPDSGAVLRSDTAFRQPLAPRFNPMGGQTDAIALLHHTLAVASADSAFDWRLTISDPSRYAGSVVGGRLDIPSFDGLSISSLVVGPEDAGRTLSRGEVAFAAAPYLIYTPGQPIGIYYEIYGLEARTLYRTQIELVRQRDGVLDRLRGLIDGSIRLRFDAEVESGSDRFGVQERRSIAWGDVDPGLWRLRVTITDLTSGATTQRETLIEVGPPL